MKRSGETKRSLLCYYLLLSMFLAVVFLSAPSSSFAALLKSGGGGDAASYNPHPDAADFILPMPDNGKMVFRHVCVPADSLLDDFSLDLGNTISRKDPFKDRRHLSSISGPFLLQDLPQKWRERLAELSGADGICPRQSDKLTAYYYFIGKYEVTVKQYNQIMGKSVKSVSEPSWPMTNISWFDAVEFSRRYTDWLLKNHRKALPTFKDGRVAFIRLPTESEWEFAARGAHYASDGMLRAGTYFDGAAEENLNRYAVFRETDLIKEKLAPVGSRKPNPAGLYDTAGNAEEMMLDNFRFSVVRKRLHGISGGVLVKGGSYLKGASQASPGYREEKPLYLSDGPNRAKDLGMRIVLASIVTPAERNGALDKAWKSVQEQTIRIGSIKENAANELQRLIKKYNHDKEISSYLSKVREIIIDRNLALKEQQRQGIDGLIRSSVFTIESIYNYALRRAGVVKNLKRIYGNPSFMKTPRGQKIRKETETTLVSFNSAISGSILYYIKTLKMIAEYDSQLFAQQLEKISNEFNSSDDKFHRLLKRRLDVYKQHLKLLNNSTGAEFNERSLLKAIIPENLQVEDRFRRY